ncbi:MAG TPA: hypothetical protein VEK33_17175 [Terriglobales bacterium]|nr:hypothetical protein [Terriglobales bacterium]
MQLRCKAMVLAFAASLSVSSVVSRAETQKAKGAAVQKDVPAEFQAAISEMQNAKSSLERAGDKWGGHRVKAIAFIDQALRVAGQPPAASKTEMDSGPKDEPAEMQSGTTALQNAESDFERSGNEWGGRRAKAMSLIHQALEELQLGIDFAKSHGTY